MVSSWMCFHGIKLNTNLELTSDSIKGQFIYAKPNFNYSDNTLFTSLKSSTTDLLTNSGYKTSEIGFSLGKTLAILCDGIWRDCIKLVVLGAP